MTTTIKETNKVMEMLKEYESTGSSKVLYNILYNVLNTKLEKYIYDVIYNFNSLLLKSLAIKTAPESWLREKMMTENDTHLVCVMIERSDRESLKYDANKLIHASNWQVRLYAVEKANNKKEVVRQLMVEDNFKVMQKLLAKF